MSEQQHEKNIKKLTTFSKTSLKNKLHLAIEKNDKETIDEILLMAEENNFDLINHINIDEDNYHTTVDSMLNFYVKALNEKEKELKKSFNLMSNKQEADFSLLNSLVNKGLIFKNTYTIQDNKKDIFNVLFRFDFDKLSSEMRTQLWNNLIVRIPFEDMSLNRYINLVNSHNFLRTPKGKNRYEEKNIALFDRFLSEHISKNIPLKVTGEDLNDFFSLVRNNSYAIKTSNIKGMLNLLSGETLIANDHFEYVFRLLLETKDKDYVLDFLTKNNINFNEEMNKKYSVTHFGTERDELPLMAKLIVQPNSKNQSSPDEDDILYYFSDYFNFKYTDTPFSSVFKEDYYMSYHSYYYTSQNEIFERMIDKGMDFYSEDLNSGTNIFDYAFTHSSSRYLFNYLFEKNKWDIDYINPHNKTIIDTFIISNEISYLQKGENHNRENTCANHYIFDLLKKKYVDSFIPDNFLNDALRHSTSYYAKLAVEAFRSNANPDFRSLEGYDINTAYSMFPAGNYFSYFDLDNVKVQFKTRQSLVKGQNFLHVLFQNKESTNLIQILNKTIDLGSLAWLEKDKNGNTPFYYLPKNPSYFNRIDYNFEDFVVLANKLPAPFFLSQKNFDNIPLADVLSSYFTFDNEDKAKYVSVIEKKKLELSLNIHSSEVDSGVNKKKRL